MSDENVVGVDGPVTTIRLHRRDILPAVGGRKLTSGVVGDTPRGRLAEFR